MLVYTCRLILSLQSLCVYEQVFVWVGVRQAAKTRVSPGVSCSQAVSSLASASATVPSADSTTSDTHEGGLLMLPPALAPVAPQCENI